jgi:hypothetical protein
MARPLAVLDLSSSSVEPLLLPSLDAIASDVHLFGHMQLHLTGHVRKGNAHLSFSQIVNAIRIKSGLPTLEIAPPQRKAEPV